MHHRPSNLQKSFQISLACQHHTLILKQDYDMQIRKSMLQ
nr:unnamed protein product [Callosobruchus chinensis]